MFAGASALLLATAAVASDGASFFEEVDAAMGRMMSAMEVERSGDIDADFVAMMEPHHQGAIDMAIAELRFGKNEQLRRIAQEIIIDQQQEIAAMRIAVGKSLPASAPAPTNGKKMTGMHHQHEEKTK
nr:DUF305 domain-containing protein [Sphingomonas xinjiangensis]